MKQLTSAVAIAGAIVVVIGAAFQITSVAMTGWVLTMIFSVVHLECCRRERKHQEERRQRQERKKQANYLDTYQFSVELTREQLLRDREKINL